jgi:hypothetical protein
MVYVHIARKKDLCKRCNKHTKYIDESLCKQCKEDEKDTQWGRG